MKEITYERRAHLFAEMLEGELWLDTSLQCALDIEDVELVTAMEKFIWDDDANVEIIQKFRIADLVGYAGDICEDEILLAMRADMLAAIKSIDETLEWRRK